jgi:sugar phosphate isomerase/epimerase
MTRYSFNTWNHSTNWGLPATLGDQIVAAAAAGYDHVGLDVPSLREHDRAEGSMSALRDECDARGIDCHEIAALVISDDADATADSLAFVARAVDTFAAPAVLAVVHGAVTPSVVDATRRCVDIVAERGARTAVEFLPVLPIASIEAVVDLIDQVDHPALTVMIDSWHFFAGPSTWASLAALPVERLGFVQLSDAAAPEGDDVAHEYRHRRVLPGEGVHDVRAFAEAVQHRFGSVVVSVEVLSLQWRARPLPWFASASLEAARRTWDASLGGAP